MRNRRYPESSWPDYAPLSPEWLGAAAEQIAHACDDLQSFNDRSVIHAKTIGRYSGGHELFFDEVADAAGNDLRVFAERIEARIIAGSKEAEHIVIFDAQALGELTLGKLLSFQHFCENQAGHSLSLSVALLFRQPAQISAGVTTY